jgi:TPR repeat protein
MTYLKSNILIALVLISTFCFGNKLHFTEAQIAQFSANAELGIGSDQYNLAFAYQHGHGVEQSTEKAKHWYLEAAQSPHANIRYKVGRLFETGQVFDQNFDKAVELYTYAANKDDPFAQNNLALMYLQGKGVKKNIDKAIVWFEKASESSVVNAYVNLALIYQQNKSTHDKSIYWWNKAANEDYPEAYFQLGQFHYWKKNYEDAFHYFKRGAEINHSNSQLKLAMFYDRGIGTKKSREDSLLWLNKAAKSGNEKAIAMLKTSAN